MTESEVCAPFSLRARVNVHHSICVTGRLLITKKPINNMASRSVGCYFYLPPTIHKTTEYTYNIWLDKDGRYGRGASCWLLQPNIMMTMHLVFNVILPTKYILRAKMKVLTIIWVLCALIRNVCRNSNFQNNLINKQISYLKISLIFLEILVFLIFTKRENSSIFVKANKNKKNNFNKAIINFFIQSIFVFTFVKFINLYA